MKKINYGMISLTILTLFIYVRCGENNSVLSIDTGDFPDSYHEDGLDSGGDVVVDGSFDIGWDVGPESDDTGIPDTGIDSGSDGGMDSGEDAGIDTGFDAGFDSGTGDAGLDSGYDSGFDGGKDAGSIDVGILKDIVLVGTCGSIPCYWDQGGWHALPTDYDGGYGYGNAFSIDQEGADIYISGTAGDQSLGMGRPVYWKNGVVNSLSVVSEKHNSYAYNMDIVNGNIYIAGRLSDDDNNYIASYWKNGVRTDLPRSSGAASSARAIFITPTEDVFIGGWYRDSGGIISPAFWKNGTRTDLPNPYPNNAADVYSIFYYSGKVYSAGKVTDSTGTLSAPAYWINDVRTDLPTMQGQAPGYAYSIFIDSGDIYVAGATGSMPDITITIPGYWKNKNFIPLPKINDNYSGQAFTIKIGGEDLYLGGYTRKTKTDDVPCLWKNGVRYDLPGWGYVNSILIKK